MKRTSFIAIGIAITITLIIALYFLLDIIDISKSYFIASAFIVFLTGVYVTVYLQKLQKPHCEICKNELKFISRQKVDQLEDIRNGKFVFINTYHYQYHCNHCRKDIEITKKVKMK